jgi:WD40 repeat protein
MLFLSVCLLTFAGTEPNTQTPIEPLWQLGTTRPEYHGDVLAIAFSPSGKTLAAASWDGSIRLWDLATRKELLQYVGHTGWVQTMVFSSDGKLLATGGRDGDVIVWEVGSGKMHRRLAGNGRPVLEINFAPDQRLLAARTGDDKLHVWDTTGNEVLTFKADHSWESRQFFFADPNTIVTLQGVPAGLGRWNQAVTFWDVALGQRRKQILPQSPLHFHGISVSPDGKLLAALVGAHGFTALRLWSLPGVEGPADFKLPSWGRLGFSPDWRLVSQADDTSVRILERITVSERYAFRLSRRGSVELALSPDDRLLAVAGPDLVVNLYDLTGRATPAGWPVAHLDGVKMRELWDRLKDAEAALAGTAIWELTADPEHTVAFIKEHLPPVNTADNQQLTTAIRDLDNDRFATRERAMGHLEKLGELAGSALVAELPKSHSLETRRRIEGLLQQVATSKTHPSGERLRMLRAIEILEHIATSEAAMLLKELSQGAPSAQLTEEAAAALRRLERPTSTTLENSRLTGLTSGRP